MEHTSKTPDFTGCGTNFVVIRVKFTITVLVRQKLQTSERILYVVQNSRMYCHMHHRWVLRGSELPRNSSGKYGGFHFYSTLTVRFYIIGVENCWGMHICWRHNWPNQNDFNTHGCVDSSRLGAVYHLRQVLPLLHPGVPVLLHPLPLHLLGGETPVSAISSIIACWNPKELAGYKNERGKFVLSMWSTKFWHKMTMSSASKKKVAVTNSFQ
jgi:hypothetical protein